MSHAEISIPINDDNIFEGNENFTLSNEMYNINATVTILDDDRKLIN